MWGKVRYLGKVLSNYRTLGSSLVALVVAGG